MRTHIKSLWANTCSLSGLVVVDVHIELFKNPILESPSAAWKYSNCIRWLVTNIPFLYLIVDRTTKDTLI